MGTRLDIMFSRQKGSDLHKLNGELKNVLSTRFHVILFTISTTTGSKEYLEIHIFKVNTKK